MAHMRRRAALPNAHFVSIGDLWDMILPGDPRFMPSNNMPELATTDDYIDASVLDAYGKLKEFPFDLVGLGNHGHSMVKHHFTNPVGRLANKLGARYGGFSGFVKFRFREKGRSTKDGTRGVFTLLYHHGGASGSVTKGLPWAKRYSACWEGWDIFAWGHNHQSQSHPEARGFMNKAGNIKKRTVYMVNAGTWLESYKEGGTPSYAEIKGFPLVALQSPLIKVTPVPRSFGVQVAIIQGEHE